MAGNTLAKTVPTTSMTRQNGGNGSGHLTLRSPREELTHISQLMEDFARRVFGYGPGFGLLGPSWMDASGLGGSLESLAEEPQVDIYEREDAFQMFVSLPGYTSEQIHIETTGDSFLIHRERQALQQDEKASPRRKNRVSSDSQFRIEASLPGEIEPGKATANFENGILEVTLPKSQKSQKNAVSVPIQTK